jgi:phosphocarrier protein HPr
VAERTVRLANPDGLHARPAGRFATEAARFSCEVTVGKDGKFVNGKSILRLLTLDCRQGDEVVIRTDGIDEAGALERLVELVLTEPNGPSSS